MPKKNSKGLPIGIEHKMRGPLWKIKYPIYPIIRYVIVAPETKSTSGYCQNFKIEKFVSYQLLKFYRRYRRFFSNKHKCFGYFRMFAKQKVADFCKKNLIFAKIDK